MSSATLISNSVISPGQRGRIGWLDASRVFAAFGIILIHCSADPLGKAFGNYPPNQRIFPVMMRMIGEISGAELFLVFSLFMLTMKVDQAGSPIYRTGILNQAKRLLVPYAVWSIFYLAFRFVKAGVFGYSAGLWAEISSWENWPGYIFTRSAQYHLHFLPTLFFIILFYPVLKGAIRFPLLGLSLVPLLFFMDTVQERIWALLHNPVMAEFLTRMVKDVGYVGYGFAAFSLFGIWRRGVSEQDSKLIFRVALCMTIIAFATTLAYGANVMMTGTWINRPGATFYAHLLIPALVFTTFMTAAKPSWSPVFSQIAKLNFGIYLIHPVFIDLYEIGCAKFGLNFGPAAMVTTKYIFACICAVAASFLISKSRLLAWTIGVTVSAGTKSRAVLVPEARA